MMYKNHMMAECLFSELKKTCITNEDGHRMKLVIIRNFKPFGECMSTFDDRHRFLPGFCRFSLSLTLMTLYI